MDCNGHEVCEYNVILAVHGAEVPALRRALVPGVLGLLCGIAWLQQAWQDFIADDAFISYRYALHWTQGLGPVFNAGERVEGYSNFLIVALAAAAHALGLDMVRTIRGLGTLSAWIAIVLVFHMLRHHFGRGTALSLAGAAAVALHAGIAAYSRSGLETVPLMCMVLWAQSRFLGEVKSGSGHWGSGFLLGVTALVRADAALYAATTVIFAACTRRSGRGLASLALPFAAIFVPWFVWRWDYYGSLLPNTWYLRAGGDIYQQLRGLFYLYKFIQPFGGLLLFALPLLLLLLRDPKRDLARLYLGVSVVAVAVYVVAIGGDHMPMSRFFIPIVPAITILSLEAIAEILRRMHAPDRVTAVRQRTAGAVLAGLLVVSGVLPALVPQREPQSHVVETRVQVAQWTRAAVWFREHLPPGSALAAEPTGALGYYSGLKIIDMMGVNDAHIARLVVPGMGRGTAAHEKHDLPYVLSRRPDVIFIAVQDAPCEDRPAGHAYGPEYALRCVPLGAGPLANRFGSVRRGELFLWYAERVAKPGPEPSQSR